MSPPIRTTRALRPKDAATLVLVRREGSTVRVLMGMRHSGHSFLPDHYVFPGGRVDRGDGYVHPLRNLRPEVAERLARSCTPRRARALALAAVRETFEETGLILGAPPEAPMPHPPAVWRAFFATGHAPILDGLDYLCRAITPTNRPRRFNTRFFIAAANGVAGELTGDGELLDLKWLPLDEARALPIPRITRLVLGYTEAFLGRGAGQPWAVPFHRQLHGKHTLSYE